MKSSSLLLVILLSCFVIKASGQGHNRIDSCNICIEQYTNLYLDEYFNVLAALTAAESDTFCADCLQSWMVDSAKLRAVSVSNALPCINAEQVTSKLDLSRIVIEWQFQEIDSTFTVSDLDFAIAINNWLGFNPQAYPGMINLPGCKGPNNCSAYFFVDGVSRLLFAENFGYGVAPLNYFWSWGDNTFDSVPYPIHTFPPSDDDSLLFFNVCLTIEDALGCIATYCDSDVFNFPPLDSNFTVIPPGTVIADFRWDNLSLGFVSFSNYSANTDEQSYYWDFGDGNNSTEKNPMHGYNSNGVYHVCLTAGNPPNSDTFCDTVRVTKLLVGLETIKKPDIRFIPNPAHNITHVKIAVGNWEMAEVIDLAGKILITQQPSSPSIQLLDISCLPQGIYICRLFLANGTVITEKIAKE